MSFSDDIKGFSEKFVNRATKTFRGTALGLMNKIVQRTPVDTGRLRGNWFSSINEPSRKVSTEEDKSGAKSVGRAKATTGAAKLGDSIYFINNLTYAKAIEDGHGADNRPGGMVKVTVEEFEQEVERQARKHKI